MNKSELIKALADDTNIPLDDAALVVTTTEQRAKLDTVEGCPRIATVRGPVAARGAVLVRGLPIAGRSAVAACGAVPAVSGPVAP